jgi:hypothetical protein
MCWQVSGFSGGAEQCWAWRGETIVRVAGLHSIENESEGSARWIDRETLCGTAKIACYGFWSVEAHAAHRGFHEGEVRT